MGQELQTASSEEHFLTQKIADEDKYVTMRVSGQLFGISVLTVQDVLRSQKVAKIPLSPPQIKGSINLRGRIVTVIDVRSRLNLPPAEESDEIKPMHVVVEYANELFSLTVDSVGEVLGLTSSVIDKSPANLSQNWKSVSSGVHKLDNELLVILDVENMLKF